MELKKGRRDDRFARQSEKPVCTNVLSACVRTIYVEDNIDKFHIFVFAFARQRND